MSMTEIRAAEKFFESAVFCCDEECWPHTVGWPRPNCNIENAKPKLIQVVFGLNPTPKQYTIFLVSLFATD